MNRWAVRHIVILAALAACNRDKAPEPGATTQQAGTSKAIPAPASANAPAGPAGAAGGTKRPANAPATAPATADPNPAAAAAAAELARASNVRTVQVGAFPNAAAARWWESKLKSEGIPAYTTTATVGGEEVTRLRIGVALTGTEARAIADKIHARYDWPVWITIVEDRSAVTGAMLSASRRYAAGG
jgi:cell division septation protein DedD